MQDADFALFNVDQLVTVSPGCHPAAQGELGVIERGAVAASGGRVVWVGPMEEFHQHVRLEPPATVLNTHGRTVLPGFVDAHTHPVFAGERSGDFYARAGGTRYHDQAESGIMSTVRATRAAGEDDLLALAFARSESFLRHGITTIGAKSGYGLDLETELKSLRVLNRLQHVQPLKLIPTFLGAHVLPAGVEDADAWVDNLIREWLPAARPLAVFCDVWCEEEAFTAEQCRRILSAARELGFELTAHASELGPGEGVRLAVEAGARSVDHVVYAGEEDIAALAGSDTVAVLLPATTFFLNSDRYAPARRLVDAGARVAVSTDFNPGTSHTQNMTFVLTLAVLKLRLNAEEAIRAATLGGAQALGMADRVGSIEPGKFCDLTVFRVPDYRQIPYQCAMNPIDSVVASGRVAVRDGQIASANGTPARST